MYFLLFLAKSHTGGFSPLGELGLPCPPLFYHNVAQDPYNNIIINTLLNVVITPIILDLYIVQRFLLSIIFSNIGLTQGFSSMNFTTFRKSFQRFNNSIPAGALSKLSTYENSQVLFLQYQHIYQTGK